MNQDGARFRWRLLATCVLLTGLAMTQSPGLLVADTKLDLAIAPLDFLGRAAHLWDAEGAFGQLQNQAYGYLWPMGPFFALGFLLDVPGWVVQRLWMALVLCVAFVGSAKVARALGVRSDLACIIGGLAFALSPRMLTVLGPSSIEVWPMALTPWVLLPLVIGAERGSPRRMAALSALAIAMVGGVNAAATSAVLPLGALWLLTRSRGPRRRALMLWWPALTLLATLWWLIPLFLLGAYSPPFLDYIESAANTTFPTNIFDSLRGTSNWVPYIDPVSRAGNDLLRQSHVIINSGVVLLLGLIGLTLPSNRHRGFLVLGLLTGLFLVGMGHLGEVQGWLGPALQDLLDGALAPLRNVHKFDPVVRLPMVLGVAFVVDELVTRLAHARAGQVRDAASHRLNTRLFIGICVIAVLGASLPAVFGRISPAGGFTDVPDYWYAAADWLDEEQDEGVALLVPGSSFGTYIWGSPRDEPFQAIASRPWAVRNAVPLTPPGNIRMLDAIESRLAQGRGGSGLATYLTRAGVSHLVVRNDLTRTPEIPDPVLVHQALAESPGIERVSTFGPAVGGAPQIEGELGKAMVNGGWQTEYPAIEVYAVDQDDARVTAVDWPVVVVGGPEDLLDLAELGVVEDQPVRLAADVTEDDDLSRMVLTDGMRAVERNFGRLHDASSQTRVEGQERTLPSRSPDYQLDDPARWSTRAELGGARAVTASSSQADASAFGPIQPGMMPFAAVDGDPATEWLSGPGTSDGHWWQIDLDGPRDLGRTAVTVGLEGREVLRLRTEDWTSPLLTFDPGDTRIVTVPGPTRWLRVEDMSGRADNRVSLVEVASDGIDAERVLLLPRLPEGSPTPDAVVLRRVGDDRAGCAQVDGDVRCRNGEARAAEEPRGFARRFSLPAAVTMPVSIGVSALPGQDWDDYVLADQPVSIAASSVVAPDQRTTAVAAIDGSPSTTWVARLGDTQPELRLNWLGRRTVSGLAVNVTPGTAARRPESFELTWPGGRRTLQLGSRGSVRFPPIRTSQLSLRVLDAEPATDIGFSGAASFVPVGISELRVIGLPYVPVLLPTAERTTPCGTGPDVRVNMRTFRTRVTASPAALFDGEQATAELCGGDEVPLRAGTNDVEVAGGSAFAVDSIVLGRAPFSGPVGRPASTQLSPTRLRVENPGAGRHVATHANTNPGWEAREGDVLADPSVYDGWRQGWQVPDEGGASPLEARFGPDSVYRAGLLVGLLCLLLVGLAALRRPRRPEPPALAPGTASPVLLVALALAAGGLLAGTVGVGVAAGAVLLAVLMSRVAPATGSTWLVALLLLPAIGAYVFRPWGDSAGWAGSWAWPHYLALAACASVLGRLAADSWRRHRSEMRVPGISTTR